MGTQILYKNANLFEELATSFDLLSEAYKHPALKVSLEICKRVHNSLELIDCLKKISPQKKGSLTARQLAWIKKEIAMKNEELQKRYPTKRRSKIKSVDIKSVDIKPQKVEPDKEAVPPSPSETRAKAIALCCFMTESGKIVQYTFPAAQLSLDVGMKIANIFGLTLLCYAESQKKTTLQDILSTQNPQKSTKRVENADWEQWKSRLKLLQYGLGLAASGFYLFDSYAEHSFPQIATVTKLTNYAALSISAINGAIAGYENRQRVIKFLTRA